MLVCSLVYAMFREDEHIFKSIGEENNYAVVRRSLMSILYLGIVWFLSTCVSASMSKNLESLASFIRGLCDMVDNRDFEDNKEQDIRNRVVTDISDKGLSEKLQMEI